jgi:hypothetical protein
MKRIGVVHSVGSTPEQLSRIAQQMSDFLANGKLENMILSCSDPTYVIQIVEMCDNEGEYRAITLNKDGVKVENVDATMFKEKW